MVQVFKLTKEKTSNDKPSHSVGSFNLSSVSFFDFDITDNEIDILKDFLVFFVGQVLDLFQALSGFFIEHHFIGASSSGLSLPVLV